MNKAGLRKRSVSKRSIWKRAGSFLLAGGLVLGMSFAGVQPAAAASSAVTAAREPEDERQDFDEYMDELYDNMADGDFFNIHMFMENPSDYGIDMKRHAFSKTFLNDAGVKDDEWREKAAAVTERLSEFDLDLLDEERQMTYKIVWEYFEIAEAAVDFCLYKDVLSYTQGEHIQLPVTLTTFNIMSKEDASNYLELVADIDEYFRAILAYEQKRSEAGLFMSDDALDMVIRDCKVYADRDTENILVESFPKQLDGIRCITEEEKQGYVECLKTVVEENFYPAYDGLIKGLEKLRGTGTGSEGICSLDKGKEYYEYLVKSNVGVSCSMDELTDMVNEAYLKDYNELNELVGDQEKVNALLDEKFDSTDPEEILGLMQKRIREDWPDIGKLDYEFREVPEKLQESMSPAFYIIPQIDVPSQNVIYVNNAYVQEDIWTTIAHEGLPGHMYQINYNKINYNHKNGYRPIRRLLENSGYAEGWGTYSEISSLSYAGLSEEAARLRKLMLLESLGMPAMLDIGINYEGWTREETYNKLCELYDEEDAAGLAEYLYDYIINNPSQYLVYYVGYLEITDMRDEAEAVLGEEFSLKDFHAFILDEGNAPFKIIREDFKKWLSEQPDSNQ